jgi:hypothetical protein
MTVLIGVPCHHAVIIGADSAISTGITERPFDQKIQIRGSQVIVALTGELGLGQRFVAAVDRVWQQPLPPLALEIGKLCAIEGLKDFFSTGLTLGNFECGALMAFPCARRPWLCAFSYKTMQPLLVTPDQGSIAMGSGQLLAEPFLSFLRRVFWPAGPPTYQNAIFTVTWALEHAIAVNPGGIGGVPHIAVLTAPPGGGLHARMLTSDEIAEHRQNVQNAEAYLRSYEQLLQGTHGAPDIPKL